MPKVKAIFSTLPQKESALVDTARQHWLATPISSKGIKRKHSKVNNAYSNCESLETFVRLHVATVLQFINQRQITISNKTKIIFDHQIMTKTQMFCLELGRGQILSIKSFWWLKSFYFQWWKKIRISYFRTFPFLEGVRKHLCFSWFLPNGPILLLS